MVVLATHPRRCRRAARAASARRRRRAGRCRPGPACGCAASRSAAPASGRSYSGASLAAATRPGTSASTVAVRSVERSRSRADVAGAGPRRRPGRRRVAGPPTRAQIASTASRSLGLDDREHALLALARHHLERLHARLALRDRGRRRRPCPTPPFAAVSLAAHESPAAPRSCTPTASPASSSSRHASISRFSSNGSPTCTLGPLRRVGLVVAEPGRGEHAHAADAVAPGRRAEQHREVADARRRGRARAVRVGSMPRHNTLTSGLSA